MRSLPALLRIPPAAISSGLATRAAIVAVAAHVGIAPLTSRLEAQRSVSPAASAAAGSADSAYDRASRKWSALESVEAKFEQRITNPLLGRTAMSRGTFQQQRPGRVAITFVDPVGDRIIGDGKFLWVYLPSTSPGQVLKLPAQSDGAVVADMLGQLLETPRQTFTISGGDTATIGGRITRRVNLVPRRAGTVAFQRATLWIDEADARPVRVQIIDPQGVDRLITLTTWAPNAVIAKEAFRFAVPKGVKVVDRLPG